MFNENCQRNDQRQTKKKCICHIMKTFKTPNYGVTILYLRTYCYQHLASWSSTSTQKNRVVTRVKKELNLHSPTHGPVALRHVCMGKFDYFGLRYPGVQ